LKYSAALCCDHPLSSIKSFILSASSKTVSLFPWLALTYRNQNPGGLPIWFLIGVVIFKSDAFPSNTIYCTCGYSPEIFPKEGSYVVSTCYHKD